ncbi:MAG: theronine dehydrogenase, partial [Elusimicrobia bacterium]|nr:theronine dehydrogenase [Elusimicrobiota bacterium]
GALLVEMVAIGVCGTDREILEGLYGAAPAGSGFSRGDCVVPIVRRPDPAPCPCCAAGEWDMCLNGRYTERGISGRDGFASERFRLEPAFAVKVDAALGELAVLLEPASVVAKAWEQIERIGRRACFQPRRVLVAGGGPIGLLAALLGSQRGYEIHVVERSRSGPKPELIGGLGAVHHSDMETVKKACGGFDIALECTGAARVVLDVLCAAGPGSIACLTGVSSGKRLIELDVAGLNRGIVLENAVVFGTVNANRRHYEQAAEALGKADPSWLSRLVSRRVPLERWKDAVTRQQGDVKVALVPR